MVSTFIRLQHPLPDDKNKDGFPDIPFYPTDWHRWLNPAPSLAAIPQWQGLLIGLVMFVGGLVWIFSTLLTFKYHEDFWTVNRGGLILLIFGWGVYSYCAFYMRPEWVVPWWLGVTHVIAYAGGLWLSLVAQWRKDGYPRVVSFVMRKFGPGYEKLCYQLDRPLSWFEGKMNALIDTRDERRSKRVG